MNPNLLDGLWTYLGSFDPRVLLAVAVGLMVLALLYAATYSLRD